MLQAFRLFGGLLWKRQPESKPRCWQQVTATVGRTDKAARAIVFRRLLAVIFLTRCCSAVFFRSTFDGFLATTLPIAPHSLPGSQATRQQGKQGECRTELPHIIFINWLHVVLLHKHWVVGFLPRRVPLAPHRIQNV